MFARNASPTQDFSQEFKVISAPGKWRWYLSRNREASLERPSRSSELERGTHLWLLAGWSGWIDGSGRGTGRPSRLAAVPWDLHRWQAVLPLG